MTPAESRSRNFAPRKRRFGSRSRAKSDGDEVGTGAERRLRVDQDDDVVDLPRVHHVACGGGKVSVADDRLYHLEPRFTQSARPLLGAIEGIFAV